MNNLLSIQFVTAYRIVSWLCWVPNLLVAELIIRRLDSYKVISPELVIEGAA